MLYVINGPNLNLLGTREPGIYGMLTLADIEARCRAHASARGFGVAFHQSNHEGQLVDWLHEAGRLRVAGVAINAGAYTHTSIALHDAVKAIGLNVVELHLSNTHAREPFRHKSFLSPAVKGVIAGFGPASYTLALTALMDLAEAG
jgi:3-dehydroquinate dehydratase-2